VKTTFQAVWSQEVKGDLVLRDSPWDPIAQLLPMAGAATARLGVNQPTGRQITNAGPLDPEAFWPHADVIGGSRWPGTRGGPKQA
jgi:acetoacetate decarboxylase